MPELSVEFEVFCGTCKNGLCNKTEVRSSLRRSMPQITVEVCDRCMGEKDDEIASLKADIDKLQETIDNMETT
jgi:hypothetical protein